MEELIVIGLVCGVIAYVIYSRNKSRGSTTSTEHRSSNLGSVNTKRAPDVYRPSTSKRSSTQQPIRFIDNAGSRSPGDLDLKDLVDALTGAPLQLTTGLYQCQRCKVFYQAHSFEVIQTENNGRCVSCLHAEIVSVAGRHEQRGRNADVSVITLENYQNYVGHVITFEGSVHTVLKSRRGTDYAVMFENRSWTRGFKMVIFRGDVRRVGGESFLYGLIGHRVQVRGLLIRHKRFGYEIIVSDRAMVLRTQ